MLSIFPQWVQDLNVALGIAGFLITAAVMLQVSSLKRSFRSRARLPDIIKELEKTGSSLNGTLVDWPSRKNDARAHIKVAEALLKAAMPLLQRDPRRELKPLGERLVIAGKDFTSVKYSDPNEAWDIYSDIQSSIVRLRQSVKSLEWE